MKDRQQRDLPDRLRVLYIHPGNNPPSLDPLRNAVFHLSKYMDGDLVSITWDSKQEYRAQRSQYEAALGTWGYHASTSKMGGLAKTAWQTCFYFYKSMELSLREGRYDAIVAYGPFKTAWAALMVKALTGSRLIVQMTMNPYRSLRFHRTPLSRFKARLVEITLPTLMRFTDHLHLMYVEQVDSFPVKSLPKATAFPDFVPTSMVPSSQGEEGYILFLGFPWHLKGVDVLIRAFNLISPHFPEIRLKLVGHCPDPSVYRKLAGGNGRIEIQNRALPHNEAMNLMSRCNFFVLPSRTEGMPRVIQEAWAAGKAVVASAVDGIPFYVKDGENGLLFPSENVEVLAKRMRELLDNPEEARRMGENGARTVHSRFNEDEYAKRFDEMVRAAVDASET